MYFNKICVLVKAVTPHLRNIIILAPSAQKQKCIIFLISPSAFQHYSIDHFNFFVICKYKVFLGNEICCVKRTSHSFHGFTFDFRRPKVVLR